MDRRFFENKNYPVTCKHQVPMFHFMTNETKIQNCVMGLDLFKKFAFC